MKNGQSGGHRVDPQYVRRPANIKVFHRAAAAVATVGGARPYRSAPESAARNELRIVRSWFSSTALVLAVFATVWDSTVWSWYTFLFQRGREPVYLFLIPVGHVAIGVWVTYTALSSLLNRTVISVDARHLRVRTGPIPTRGGRVDLHVADIADVSISSSSYRTRRGRAYRYCVVAKLADGTFAPLVRELDEVDQARFIAQRISAHIEPKLRFEA